MDVSLQDPSASDVPFPAACAIQVSELEPCHRCTQTRILEMSQLRRNSKSWEKLTKFLRTPNRESSESLLTLAILKIFLQMAHCAILRTDAKLVQMRWHLAQSPLL